MKRRNFLIGAGVAATCFAGAAATPGAMLMAQTADATWSIGPTVRGKNHSPGLPATMRETPEGAAFDFPYPRASAGHVHYVTAPAGSLAGASRMVIRYRIDAAPGTRSTLNDAKNGFFLSLRLGT